METQKDQTELEANKIVFNPEPEVSVQDISLELKNLEIEEGEVLKEIEYSDKYEQFISEKEFQNIFEDYINLKKSKINEVYTNPLYFIKKIIYFYNKETFLDYYFLYLKSPPILINKKKEQEKYISFEAKSNKDNKEAFFSLDLTNKKFDVMIKPDNRIFTIFFNAENNNINIPIKYLDKSKNELTINSYSKKSKKLIPNNANNSGKYNNGNINFNNSNSFDSKKKEDSFNNSSSDDKNNNNNGSNSNPKKSSKKGDNSKELLSKENTLISYEEKNDDDFRIFTKENNDNLLLEFNKEKIGGEEYEAIINRTFELMCNISLNRDIKIKTCTHKNPDKINLFFNLDEKNKINTFQIDTYLSKISGKELNKIHERFPNNFIFFEELKINDSNYYEIIGEVSQNIVNNSKQKIVQEFNYIHLITKFNNYYNKKENNFISLCNYYGLNNIEKIFILFTDGSYIRTKYLINLINKNKNEILKCFKLKRPKKEILDEFSKYLKDIKELDILEIDLDKFYNLCVFYNNLKSSGIKFCFCFIADVIEDKLENRIEEKIKLYLYDDKVTDKRLQIKEEAEPKNIQINRNEAQDLNKKLEIKEKKDSTDIQININDNKDMDKKPEIREEKDSKEKKANDFIIKMCEIIKKNNKLKAGLIFITDKIRRKIKEFAENKNDILNELESSFNSYLVKSEEIFFKILLAIIPDLNNKNLIQKIYLNKIIFFIIFLSPKENKIKINEIKETLQNSAKGLLFEIIQNENVDDADKYINSKNIKNKICVKIYISNDEIKIKYLKTRTRNENELFFCPKNNYLEISLTEVIKRNFKLAKNIYIKEFYNNNKNFFPELKEKKEMLSQNNIIKKICYDLKLIGINEENIKHINLEESSFSFKFNESNEDDLQFLKIGEKYYKSIIDMIKNLLDISKIKKDNNVVDFFIHEQKYKKVFISLMENIKCKCFYHYFLFQYVKNNIEINDEIIFPKIILKDIIKNE